MKKRIGLFAVAMVMVVVFVAACGSEQFSGDGGFEAPGEPDVGNALIDGDASTLANDESRGFDASATSAQGPSIGGEGGGLTLPQQLDRKIIRTATLELEVEAVGAAVQEVESIAVAAGGFVSRSSVFIEEPSELGEEDDVAPRRTQTATVTIRVPAEVYASVMSQLRGIAEEVRSEISEASEVTEEYTDLQARLRNLEATEAGYLELLTKAEEISDILIVQDRINSVRLEIEQVQGRINLLDSLTDLATITVQLTLPVAPAEEPDGGQGWAAEAWDVAWEGSQDAMVALGTMAIVGGVVLAWLAIPALVALAAWRLFGPRRSGGGEAGGTGTSV
ncbi:MAG: DUF4349 domain-containing protein [Chloroflexi bacterium]|nr:DUF4349 domain-containing protein [Chloroflexota bacterium]